MIDIKLWWDNRETLNTKMLSRLLEDLREKRDRAATKNPTIKSQDLIRKLDHRIDVLSTMLSQ